MDKNQQETSKLILEAAQSVVSPKVQPTPLDAILYKSRLKVNIEFEPQTKLKSKKNKKQIRNQ